MKNVILTILAFVYFYIGLKLAASKDPEFNWIIKLLGFFAWLYLPSLFFHKTKGGEE